jgi:hypothetical protein
VSHNGPILTHNLAEAINAIAEEFTLFSRDVGPDFRIGNNVGFPNGINFTFFFKRGIKYRDKNFSHLGINLSKFTPGSVMVDSFKVPTNSIIRKKPKSVIQSLILGIW